MLQGLSLPSRSKSVPTLWEDGTGPGDNYDGLGNTAEPFQTMDEYNQEKQAKQMTSLIDKKSKLLMQLK